MKKMKKGKQIISRPTTMNILVIYKKEMNGRLSIFKFYLKIGNVLDRRKRAEGKLWKT